MRRPQRPKALLISLGVYLSLFAASVNAPEWHVQASESHDEDGLYLYILGRITHIGLGLDVLDEAGRPVGVRVWDFGSRNHYKNKDDEWISGRRNLWGSFNNVSLLFGPTEGEMRAWDPTRRFGMSLEQFKRSSRIKARIRISRTQWAALRAWLQEQAARFAQHERYPELGLDIWYGAGPVYDLFRYNCATFIGEALFAAGVFTADNVPRTAEGLEPVPSRWLFPPSAIAHYRQHPVLSREQVSRLARAFHQKRSCNALQRLVSAPPWLELGRGAACALG